jgi:preprotein translocase subunit SecE
MAEEVVSISQKAAGWPAEFRNYVEDLRMEMRRVTWPAWKQVRATTLVVIAATFAFAAYFFVVDNIVSRLIQKLFDTFAK